MNIKHRNLFSFFQSGEYGHPVPSSPLSDKRGEFPFLYATCCWLKRNFAPVSKYCLLTLTRARFYLCDDANIWRLMVKWRKCLKVVLFCFLTQTNTNPPRLNVYARAYVIKSRTSASWKFIKVVGVSSSRLTTSGFQFKFFFFLAMNVYNLWILFLSFI